MSIDLEDNNEAESLTNIPQGPGDTLRAARESKGWSIEDVSKRMRLQKAIFENLEADEYDDGTALVFVRGYLRSYAGLLGLNPEEIINAFNTLGLKEERDIREFVKLKAASQSKFKLPVSAKCHPAILWGSVASMALAFVGLLWAYVGDASNIQPTTATTAEITDGVDELQEYAAAKVKALQDDESDANEVTEKEDTVAIIPPADTNPQAEALIF